VLLLNGSLSTRHRLRGWEHHVDGGDLFADRVALEKIDKINIKRGTTRIWPHPAVSPHAKI
jgi:hypothetical protein